MVRSRPLRMIVNAYKQKRLQPFLREGVEAPAHLGCHFQYNNGEPMDPDAGDLTVQTVYEVTGGVSGGYKARQGQGLTFGGTGVLIGRYHFADCEVSVGFGSVWEEHD